MNKTEKKEVSELSESEFMKRWTAKSKELDSVKEDCRWFRQEYDRRLARMKIEDMPAAERDALREALAQDVSVDGVTSEESVNG